MKLLNEDRFRLLVVYLAVAIVAVPLLLLLVGVSDPVSVVVFYTYTGVLLGVSMILMLGLAIPYDYYTGERENVYFRYNTPKPYYRVSDFIRDIKKITSKMKRGKVSTVWLFNEKEGSEILKLGIGRSASGMFKYNLSLIYSVKGGNGTEEFKTSGFLFSLLRTLKASVPRDTAYHFLEEEFNLV